MNMMVIILAVILAGTILAWRGVRKPAIYSFLTALALSVIWFLHHVTSYLNIDL
jgi:hypothetical protein